MKPEDLHFMFGEMVQRTEQLFFSITEVTDSRFTNLPSFLTALASIVREMEEVSMWWSGGCSSFLWKFILELIVHSSSPLSPCNGVL